MANIHKLPEEVVAKIAAGEIIERPVFAVKELLDNAIDANATQIEIRIWDSGLKKIIVQDNGFGMAKDDVFASVLPHTTSKIFEEDDLVGITTLGFRGEALSSIAAVSNLTLESRTKKNTAGAFIKVKYGKIQQKGHLGMPVGTKVSVENLFGNTPARKKFLKTLRTEFRHILDTIIAVSIANPHIAFLLVHNEKTIIDVPKTQDKLERINTLLGQSTAEHFIPLAFQDGYVSLTGYIGHPQFSSSSAQKLYIYVNNRKISNSLIAASAKDAYANLLDHHAYPTGVLFITVPFETVDVNVHPRKEEVAFVEPQVLYASVNTAVKDTLNAHNLTFFNVSWQQGLTHTQSAKLLKEEVLLTDVANIGKIKKSSDIIQVHHTYLITESKKGLLLVDQHAAHEALLYREFVKAFKNRKSETTPLESPLLVSFPVSDFEVLTEHKEFFTNLGFEFEEFGDTTVRFNSVPVLFSDRDIEEVVTEMITDIRQEKIPKTIDEKSKKMLATLACKNAIKAGERLTKQQARELIDKLQPADMLYTCPHGRPVKIDIPLSTLERWMKRK